MIRLANEIDPAAVAELLAPAEPPIAMPRPRPTSDAGPQLVLLAGGAEAA